MKKLLISTIIFFTMIFSVSAVIVEKQVSLSTDDAYHTIEGWPGYEDSTKDLAVGNRGSNGPQFDGYRWTGLGIPENSIITDAYVEFTQSGWGDDIVTTLAFQDTANPLTFSEGNSPYHRWQSSRTAWELDWSWPKQKPNAKIQTPSLAAGIQELVNKHGAVDSIVLMEDGTGLGNNVYHEWWSFDGKPVRAPKIHIEYIDGAPDLTAPVRSNGQPSGTLPEGTISATVSLDTDENAICKYSTVAGINYSAMVNTFGSTGGLAHSELVSGLVDGSSNDYYVKCQDVSGNANTDDFVINFNVAADLNAPVLSNGQPSGLFPAGTASATISLDTNEGSICKYDINSGVDYDLMNNTFTLTGGASHSELVSGLVDGSSNNYYVRCNDTSGNFNTVDFLISFDIDTPDETAPIISNINAVSAVNTATITWDTDEGASSQVEYGLTTALGTFTGFDPALVLGHSVQLTVLDPNTTYYYKVLSNDSSGNGAIAPAVPNSFTTLELPLEFGIAKLEFSIQPGDGSTGSSLPTIEVTVKDGFGNVITNASKPIKMTLGNNPSGATLGGTTTKLPVNGVAVFDDLTVNQAAAGYRLVAYTDPNLLSNWDEADHQYSDVWGHGNYAIIGSKYESKGAPVLDISDPANPVLVATLASSSEVQEIRSNAKGIGILATHDDGFWVYNFSNLPAANLLGHVTQSEAQISESHNMDMDGDFVFIASNSNDKIQVFDVSDPTNPVRLDPATSPVSNSVHGVTAKNGKIYGADNSNPGLMDVFDATTLPGSNTHIKNWDAGSSSHSSYPSEDENFLFVAHEECNGNVGVWDISNLASPSLVSEINPGDFGWGSSSAHDPVVVDNILYVSWANGLHVFEVSDPANPVLVGSQIVGSGGCTDTGMWGVAPVLGADRVLGSDWSNGLYVVDTSPSAMRSVSFNIGISDTTAPVRSNGAPSGLLAAGTASATISLDTNEDAICKYDIVADVAYDLMNNTFGTTGSTSHSDLVTGLVDGSNNNYYVKCEDGSGNANLGDFVISFSIDVPDLTAPVISNINDVSAVNTASITWDTDEGASSQVEYGLTTALGTFTAEDAALVTSHSVGLSGLLANTAYYYKVISKDSSDNEATAPVIPNSFTTLDQPVDLSKIRLEYTVQPINNEVAELFPIIKVSVLDEFDNLVADASKNIILMLANNPSGATLSGTLTRSPVNGVAVFDDLSIDQVGSEYTLIAYSPLELLSNWDGSTETYGDVWGEGNIAVMGHYFDGSVEIFDITDPTSPVLASHWDNPSGSQNKDGKVVDGIGYFSSDNGGGVWIVNVTDPYNPVNLAHITDHSSVHNVFVKNNYLYFATYRHSEVYVYDISDPANPVFVTNIPQQGSGEIHDVSVVDGKIFTYTILG